MVKCEEMKRLPVSEMVGKSGCDVFERYNGDRCPKGFIFLMAVAKWVRVASFQR